MGKHGQNKIEELLLGSVAEHANAMIGSIATRVVHLVKVPVVLIK